MSYSTREDQADSAAIHSSIALLQERFRKLQKVKEMREERELMRILAEPKQHMKNLNNVPNMHCEQSRSFFHSEFILPPPPGSPPQVPLPILPPSQSKHSGYSAGYSDGAGTLLMNSWPIDDIPSSAALTPSNKFKDSDSDTDVDTSLHL
ncbi:hypothetical protein I3842_10G078600 [Carya illinoinensis]|uniref:Uncharacterized protein n=1 Tax=Carya illinoinensis TaxID=32201 RepID=A0A922DWE6_CARIL|nr:hypothetical protein I3842_10G078600 [Carya illinoinensis]